MNPLPEPVSAAALEQSHCLPPHQPPPARVPAGQDGWGWRVTQPQGCWVVTGTARRRWEMPRGGQAASWGRALGTAPRG